MNGFQIDAVNDALQEQYKSLYLTKALQHPDEIAHFVKLVRSECCKSYLEIGAKYGGSLWHIGQALEPNSRIVVVDLPHGTRKWFETEPSLKACAERLQEMGHSVTLIWGNSQDDKIVAAVGYLGPYDLGLIDADHRKEGLALDWKNYGPMCKMVAFHDIAWHRPADWQPKYPRIDVPQLWEFLRPHYRNVEIKLDPKNQDNGIGVIWR